MAEYDPTNPSERDKRKHDLVYDAWHNRYVKRDGSDTPNQNFGVNHHRSKDGMLNEFTRGQARTPEGHEQIRAEKLAYDSVFDGGYAENKPYKETKGLARFLFGK